MYREEEKTGNEEVRDYLRIRSINRNSPDWCEKPRKDISQNNCIPKRLLEFRISSAIFLKLISKPHASVRLCPLNHHFVIRNGGL